MSPLFQNWFDSSNGRPIDIDGYYGNQCVDVIMSWSQYCYQGHGWPELLGFGNAADLYDTANPQYFEKIPYTKGFIPKEGDIGVISGSSGNPEGHVYVVISAGANDQFVIEQNGYNPSGVAYTTNRGYTKYLRGFLRPKGITMEQPINDGDFHNLYPPAIGREANENDKAYWKGKTSWKDFMYDTIGRADFAQQYKAEIGALKAAQSISASETKKLLEDAGRTNIPQQEIDYYANAADGRLQLLNNLVVFYSGQTTTPVPPAPEYIPVTKQLYEKAEEK